MSHATEKGLGKKQALLQGQEKPPALSVMAECIPAELKCLPRWVCWRWQQRKGKWTKPPLNPANGRSAESNDPGTWSTFEQALTVYQRGQADGVGFVFSPVDGFAGVDVDDCVDIASGQLTTDAQRLVADLDSYTEVSPSGTGVKLIVRGRIPGARKRKGNVEMYDSGRYFTLTGQAVVGTPATVEDRQKALAQLYDELFGTELPPDPASPPEHAKPLTQDDAELLRRAFAAANGTKIKALFEGDLTGYDSASEADLALCNYLAFWCQADKARMDRVFRNSQLCRPKWTDRADYRDMTLGKAIAGCRHIYEPAEYTVQLPLRNGDVCRVTQKVPVTHGGEHNGHVVGQEPTDAIKDDSLPLRAQGSGPEGDATRVHLTDRGNGLRLMEQHGEDLRHCWPWKKWLVWDRHRWRLDLGSSIAFAMKQTLVRLFREAEVQVRQIGKQLEETTND